MSVVSGTIKVTSAGTRAQAAHKNNVRTVVFKARTDNSDDVYIGGNDDTATDGMALTPGESITLESLDPISTSQYFADAAINDDQVDFIGSL